MKKRYYLYIIVILTSVAILPSITRAEQGKVLDLLRARTANIQNNLRNNEDSRNRMLEFEKRRIASTTLPRIVANSVRALASSTRAEREEIDENRRSEIQGIREQGRDDINNASTSVERREIRKDMRKEEFKVRKDTIVSQLNITLNNLKQIRARISSRITKATFEGRDMTSAKNLLVIADGKITLAEQAINSLAVLNPNIYPTQAATSTIDLTKPREVGNAAINSLKQAREALNAVVRAIAHSMGLGNATSTPIVTPPTATTTASTTTAI